MTIYTLLFLGFLHANMQFSLTLFSKLCYMEENMHFCTRFGVMQIAIGKERRNGKENEKEE